MRRENDNRAGMSNGLRFIWILFNALLFFALVAMIACGGVKTVVHGTFLERECRIAGSKELRPVFIGGCVEREGTYELSLFSSYAQLFEAAGVKDCSASDYQPDELIDFTQPVIVHFVEDGMLIRARNLNTVSVQELTALGLPAVASERVVSYREHNGPFRYKEALLNILDERDFDEIKFKLYAL